MDYIENLKEIRTELLEAENTHAKAPLYKILTYKSALDDFVEKEYAKFFTDVIGQIPGASVSKEKKEAIKVNPSLKLRALVDIKSLSETERKKLFIKNKRAKKEASEIVSPYFSNLIGGAIVEHYPINDNN